MKFLHSSHFVDFFDLPVPGYLDTSLDSESGSTEPMESGTTDTDFNDSGSIDTLESRSTAMQLYCRSQSEPQIWMRNVTRIIDLARRPFCLSGTGTGTGTGTQRHSIKMSIWFPSLAFFSFTFYNKFDETYQFFPCKNCFLWSRYGANRNRNLSKVGTGTRNIIDTVPQHCPEGI
jgi:hypothetical protein